jgi:hypothetical protein
VTWIFVPNLTGADLAEEDERFRSYLLSRGWDGEMGEKDLKAFAHDQEGIPAEITQAHKY